MPASLCIGLPATAAAAAATIAALCGTIDLPAAAAASIAARCGSGHCADLVLIAR